MLRGTITSGGARAGALPPDRQPGRRPRLRPHRRRLSHLRADRRPRPAGVQRLRRVRGPGEPGRRRPRVPARGVRRRRDRRPVDRSTPRACSSSTTGDRSPPAGCPCRCSAVCNYHSVWRFGPNPPPTSAARRAPWTWRTAPSRSSPACCPAGLRRAGRLRAAWCSTTTDGSRPARASGSTSTSSATAATIARRSRRSTRCPGHARAAALLAGQLVEPLSPYTADEYRELMERFRDEGIPLSVGVLDMDWHLVDIDPRHGSGWTGYTWNTELFPDPRGFLEWLHAKGLRVTLNVHPADGVRAHERGTPRWRPRSGGTPPTARPIAFDVTDPSSSSPTSTCCTVRWRTTASTSGGWTGSPGRTRG